MVRWGVGDVGSGWGCGWRVMGVYVGEWKGLEREVAIAVVQDDEAFLERMGI